ncbi:prolipoprotein diacylglyceryl transferase [Carboxydothermus pertinax]|uniref:Phosphatidylglycerol--prolipoprotein diacylglyceryl transferase n=1 Tax=Carboxydothermus pertinax TaxID=870242 RepID=A0A1L8CU43_9THEO|nr:prolipoprotein diacylglyceryl transferase [Carboxydothermus pertinax]
MEIRWYGVLMAVSVLIGTYLALKEARRKNVQEDHVYNLVLLGAPLGWIGARIWYVLWNWDYYRQYPAEIPAIWHGGLAFHGGILTALLVGVVYTRIKKLSFWQLADLFAPSIILGQSIGRWGNYFNQEAYGYPTNLPWAMYIAGAWRHPTFLYESLWDFGVFLYLWLNRKKQKYSGEIFLKYLLWYSVGRFIIEGFRMDSFWVGPFRLEQLLSVLLIIFSLWFMRVLGKRSEVGERKNK